MPARRAPAPRPRPGAATGAARRAPRAGRAAARSTQSGQARVRSPGPARWCTWVTGCSSSRCPASTRGQQVGARAGRRGIGVRRGTEPAAGAGRTGWSDGHRVHCHTLRATTSDGVARRCAVMQCNRTSRTVCTACDLPYTRARSGCRARRATGRAPPPTRGTTASAAAADAWRNTCPTVRCPAGTSALVAVVLVISLAALGFAACLVRAVLAADQGTVKMREIAQAVQEGAAAYLRRQFRTLGRLRRHRLPAAARPAGRRRRLGHPHRPGGVLPGRRRLLRVGRLHRHDAGHPRQRPGRRRRARPAATGRPSASRTAPAASAA